MRTSRTGPPMCAGKPVCAMSRALSSVRSCQLGHIRLRPSRDRATKPQKSPGTLGALSTRGAPEAHWVAEPVEVDAESPSVRLGGENPNVIRIPRPPPYPSARRPPPVVRQAPKPPLRAATVLIRVAAHRD